MLTAKARITQEERSGRIKKNKQKTVSSARPLKQTKQKMKMAERTALFYTYAVGLTCRPVAGAFVY